MKYKLLRNALIGIDLLFILFITLFILDKMHINLYIIGSSEAQGLILVFGGLFFHHLYIGILLSLLGCVFLIHMKEKKKDFVSQPLYIFLVVTYSLNIIFWIYLIIDGEHFRLN